MRPHPVNMTHLQKGTLGLAGVTALAIGAFILAAPHAYSAAFGRFRPKVL